MDFSEINKITIPEGEVSKILIGDTLIWQVPSSGNYIKNTEIWYTTNDGNTGRFVNSSRNGLYDSSGTFISFTNVFDTYGIITATTDIYKTQYLFNNGYNNITSVYLPNSIKELGSMSFYVTGTSNLTDIYYYGTLDEWNSISKGIRYKNGSQVIHCTDGSIDETTSTTSTTGAWDGKTITL